MKLPKIRSPFTFANEPVVPARNRRSDTPLFGERGAPGQTVFNNSLLQQDYNNDLRYPERYDIYDKMRKSDGQVKGALGIIKLPLLAANWWIAPASDDAEDVNRAKYLDNSIKNMTITWANTLRQSLLHLDYGNFLFEPVWELDNDTGLIRLRKLAPRMPKTISDYILDDNGGLKKVVQQTYIDNTYKSVDIPVEKLLVLVNEQEGSDFRGTSVLRSAYKHWFFKDKLYIIDAIGKERHSIGVDIGTLEEGADSEDERDMQMALMGLHAHEKQFFIEQAGRFSYRVEGVQGQLTSSLDSIEHHDLRILRSVLAEFAAMGAGSTGSLAMHKDKTSFFIMALESVATNVIDSFDNYLIKRWCDYNWQPSPNGYPTLRHSRLETRNVAEYASAIKSFIDAGALHPDRNIENELRDLLDLEELPDGIDPFDTNEVPDGEGETQSPETIDPVSGVPMPMPMEDWEEFLPKYHAIEKRQLDTLIALVKRHENNPVKLEAIQVPFREEISNLLFERFPDTSNESYREFFKISSRLLADVLGARLKRKVLLKKDGTKHLTKGELMAAIKVVF